MDADGNELDTQKQGLQAVALNFHQIRKTQIESTSQVVGAKEQSLSVTFETDDDLQPGDQFVIELPKWNPESRFTKPLIRQED